MLVGEKLARALEGFEPRAMEGVGYRSLDLRFVGTPLSGLGASLRGARFTPRGGPEMLYLALSRLTVELEVGGLYHAPDGLHSARLPPRVTVSVEFSLASALDLCTLQALEQLGSNPQEFFGPWRPLTAAGLVAPTQALGLAVHAAGRFEAFLTPSAQDPSGRNLVVLPDRLRAGSSVAVFDPEGSAGTPGKRTREGLSGRFDPTPLRYHATATP